MAATETKQKILVVDDEPSIVDAVATALRYEGYDVEEAGTGRGALTAVATFEPDLVVLDWMLPDIEGIEVGRRLRAQGYKTAVLFLTAKDGTENKVEALRAGGDDYVTKPFSLAEIVARIQAILRRTRGAPAGEILRYADVVLDDGRHEVFRGDSLIALTATEYSLLRYFLLNPRRVLSKLQILQNVWHYDFGGNANVVETYVSYLRKKLDAAGPPLIRTVRQVGYMLQRRDGLMRRRLSLRARLVLGVVVLAALALVVADIATYTSLKSFLLERTDSTLEADHHAADSVLNGPGPGPGDGRGNAPTPGLYIQIRTLEGKVIYNPGVSHFPGTKAPAPPELPAKISLLPPHNGEPDAVRYFTVPAKSGSERYRVRASIEPDSRSLLIVATSLHDVDSTLHRLFLVALLVTFSVLAAIVLLGLWLVRLGLRPLEAIGKTADAITAGDLSRRVARAEGRTEVGRLGLALNAMLAQIEDSDRRLRRFVADASHELRTPLAAVRAYAELFRRGASGRPQDLERAMTGIERESERMSALVEDLLLLARLDEGRPLEREPVELDALAAEAVETAHAVDPAPPIELQADHAVVLGDRDRLRQVIDNLLANVRAHTPPGSAVRVAVGSSDGKAILEVADNGPGLDADELDRVFERFFRADASRSRATGGVGLGLAIVAAVADAHGGTVSARSEPGGGATFRITLPQLTDSA